MLRSIRFCLMAAAVVNVLSACAEPEAALVIDDAMLANEDETEDWLAYGRTYSEQRFSPLTQVNASNVSELSVDWYVDLPNDRGLVSTPLVADGVMYFIGSMNVVRAVDATSGELLWEYDPQVAEFASQRMRRCGV